uniref:Uncharacterized protein n=1 Tax=Kalanchoe fedtschenkoi TaxID=63787 RepID=A0A7N1A107_KALFE
MLRVLEVHPTLERNDVLRLIYQLSTTLLKIKYLNWQSNKHIIFFFSRCPLG